MIDRPVTGFSKLSKIEKLNFLVKGYLENCNHKKEMMKSFWHQDPKNQKVFDEFSENTLTNFYFPYGVVPNVLINRKMFMVPMVIEESSVVAAAAKSAKFWLSRGGFKAEVISTEKLGQVHMVWSGENVELLENTFNQVKEKLLASVAPLLSNMEKRGGGLVDIELDNKCDEMDGYFQLVGKFETCDAMGANFINSVLESLGQNFKTLVEEKLTIEEGELQIVMAILSNYSPDCRVKAWVECPVKDLDENDHGMDPQTFAQKMERAVKIANIDVHRATTHNKGIMNGIDAVILASGNDFRAIEACAHTYASRTGKYQSLTSCSVKDGIFRFEIELPMALGTVGGLTALHPMAKTTLDILGQPSASELMEIVAVIGLAQNFSALRSLTTSGIQKGHMKMHLMNILNHLEASNEEREEAKAFFENQVISFQAVREFLSGLRNYQ